jgi:hypothetical protein
VAFAAASAVPPLETGTQLGHAAVVKFVVFQHLPETESAIETLTAEMPSSPVPESVVVPSTCPDQPAAL